MKTSSIICFRLSQFWSSADYLVGHIFVFRFNTILLRAKSLGKRRAEEFLEQRIKHNHVEFYETVKKNKLKTFTAMLSTRKVSVNGKDVVIRANHALFARLLVIREKRGVSIKELLQYFLGSIAWSLATPEGNILNYVKSKLQNVLEEKMSLVDSVPQN